MSYRIYGALVACGLAAACSVGDSRIVAPQATTSESACVSYGFSPGTTTYTTCVQRESYARLRGRMGANYGEPLIARDAQEDCAAYGLIVGTPSYERCVQREISYRRPN